ncbi:hypothetical protein [Aquamicrobium sp.]|uniref:magnesium chelatase subunit ChlI family protein n=1 Tax=Aquamicrobium sp. TaxID=1872579 RepID=UPI002587E4F5|nr:hypothetical protein [Aquamicrobium sp.]MCK9553201.1 hypothetical protein [Aquamicrobium sp.]
MHEILLLRAELICIVGKHKLMAIADYGVLPEHFKSWKTWKNKEEFQFLHVLPCRCGTLFSSQTICKCGEHIIESYRSRNKRHFWEEEYDMAIDISDINMDNYHKERQAIDNTLKKEYDISMRELSKDAIEILDTAKRRFGNAITKKLTTKIANTIAALEDSKKIEKYHILEALSYRTRY